MKYDIVEKKTEEFNGEVDSSMRLSDDDIAGFKKAIKVLEDRTNYIRSQFTDRQLEVILDIVNRWPDDKVPPVLNVVRMMMFHPYAVKKWSESILSGKKGMPEALVSRCSSDSELVQLCAIQALSNMFSETIHLIGH